VRTEAATRYLVAEHGLRLEDGVLFSADRLHAANALTSAWVLSGGRGAETTLPSTGAALVVEYAFRGPEGEPQAELGSEIITPAGLSIHAAFMGEQPLARVPMNVDHAIAASRQILDFYAA